MLVSIHYHQPTVRELHLHAPLQQDDRIVDDGHGATVLLAKPALHQQLQQLPYLYLPQPLVECTFVVKMRHKLRFQFQKDCLLIGLLFDLVIFLGKFLEKFQRNRDGLHLLSNSNLDWRICGLAINLLQPSHLIEPLSLDYLVLAVVIFDDALFDQVH